MDNAKNIPCSLLINPTDKKFHVDSRDFQGCATIAITHKGRIYAGWYAGGRNEPHMDNYNLLIYSDDFGKTWTDPYLVIPSSKEHLIHALDIQLWISPEGKLYVFWVQNNVRIPQVGEQGLYVDGYLFGDRVHAEWVTVCDDPDAEQPQFSVPRYLDKGFLRCKPLVLKNGRWLNFNYSQDDYRYQYSISDNKGISYRHMYGAYKKATPFDETMAYQKRDGSIRMFARTYDGELAESTSYDNAETWIEAKYSGIESPGTRFFISRTPFGNILLVNNDHRYDRCRMTVYLSEDDGMTWRYKKCIDPRDHVSYPDVDFYDGKIYLIHDRDRVGCREILFYCFTEDDIKDPDAVITSHIISKPVGTPA